MIRLLAIRCPRCARPHLATPLALANSPSCPFCGEPLQGLAA